MATAHNTSSRLGEFAITVSPGRVALVTLMQGPDRNNYMKLCHAMQEKEKYKALETELCGSDAAKQIRLKTIAEQIALEVYCKKPTSHDNAQLIDCANSLQLSFGLSQAEAAARASNLCQLAISA